MRGHKKKAEINRELKTLGRLAHRLTKRGKYKEAEEKYALLLGAGGTEERRIEFLGDIN